MSVPGKTRQLALVVSVLTQSLLAADGAEVSFENDIAPVLESKCLVCHNLNQ